LSTPRDFNQSPASHRSGEPAPGQGPGSPQQGEIPWYQQPTRVDRSPAPWPAPQSPQQPPGPAAYPGAAQYGQPPPQGQWSQPSAEPPATTSKAGGSTRKYFLIGAAVVTALIVFVGVVLVVSGVLKHDTKKLAIAGVQTEVQQILVDRITGYNSNDIKDVKCNNGQDPTVTKGGSFNCDVTVRGKQHQVTVTFPDNSGTYEVGLPQLTGGK
jgi:hypothetical protein